MPDDLETPSLRRFARDLRRVREERDVSITVIQEETQVHSSHLESFESGTLHEEERMNEIYLKAFVRAYAEAIGLPPEAVVDHLELAISGAYDNQLAAEFLDVPSTRDDSSDEDASEAGPSQGGEAVASDRSPPPEERSEDAEGTPNNSSQGSSDEPTGNFEESSPMQAEDSGAPGEEESWTEAGHVSSNEVEDSPEHFSDVTAERKVGDQRSSPEAQSPGSSRPSSPTSPLPERVWGFLGAYRTMILAIIGIVFVLAMGGVLGSYFFGDDDPSSGSTVERDPTQNAGVSEDGSATPDAAVDTATSEVQSDRPPPANVTLGDTLHVTVRATSDVRELRVQQDDNLRRPYWIEAGEALVFPFTERITLQNQLDSLQLLLEGHPYPTDPTDDQGRVVIQRDTAEQFADTLRGAPVAVGETRDTIWGDGPPGAPDTLSSDP